MNKKYFYISLVVSIVVQTITGIIDIGAFFTKVSPDYFLIKQLLALELIVQAIEGVFYFWLAYHFNKIANVTPKRYLDWMVTTPTMLITLILYLIYLNRQDKPQLDFFTLLKENASVVIPVLLLNWAMLLFGYLTEINILSTLVGVGLGFIPFLIYYYMIYVNYVSIANHGHLLFWYFFIFWALYGIIALLPYYTKNLCYNIVDVFSKNFFGIFLSFIIFSQAF